jgi:cysteine desulfuration protein SufE
VTLEEKKNDLIERLSYLENGQERLAYIVDAAKKFPALPKEFKTAEYRVEGCLSNLWFVPEMREEKCFFSVDADSQIVRAIAALLADFYSDQRPEEILKFDPSFLGPVGITQHLSPNRRNGLSRLWDQIRAFAQAHLPKG